MLGNMTNKVKIPDEFRGFCTSELYLEDLLYLVYGDDTVEEAKKSSSELNFKDWLGLMHNDDVAELTRNSYIEIYYKYQKLSGFGGLLSNYAGRKKELAGKEYDDFTKILEIFRIAAYGEGVIESHNGNWIQDEYTSYAGRLEKIINQELRDVRSKNSIENCKVVFDLLVRAENAQRNQIARELRTEAIKLDLSYTEENVQILVETIIKRGGLDENIQYIQNKWLSLTEDASKKVLKGIIICLKSLIVSCAEKYQGKAKAEEVKEYLSKNSFIFGISENTKEELYRELDCYPDLMPDHRRKIKAFIACPRSPINSIVSLQSFLSDINPPLVRKEIDDLQVVQNLRKAIGNMRTAQNDILKHQLSEVLSSMPDETLEIEDEAVYQGIMTEANRISQNHFCMNINELIKDKNLKELEIDSWQIARDIYNTEFEKISYFSQTTKNLIAAESKTTLLWGMSENPLTIMAKIKQLYNEIAVKFEKFREQNYRKQLNAETEKISEYKFDQNPANPQEVSFIQIPENSIDEKKAVYVNLEKGEGKEELKSDIAGTKNQIDKCDKSIYETLIKEGKIEELTKTLFEKQTELSQSILSITQRANTDLSASVNSITREELSEFIMIDCESIIQTGMKFGETMMLDEDLYISRREPDTSAFDFVVDFINDMQDIQEESFYVDNGGENSDVAPEKNYKEQLLERIEEAKAQYIKHICEVNQSIDMFNTYLRESIVQEKEESEENKEILPNEDIDLNMNSIPTGEMYPEDMQDDYLNSNIWETPPVYTDTESVNLSADTEIEDDELTGTQNFADEYIKAIEDVTFESTNLSDNDIIGLDGDMNSDNILELINPETHEFVEATEENIPDSDDSLKDEYVSEDTDFMQIPDDIISNESVSGVNTDTPEEIDSSHEHESVLPDGEKAVLLNSEDNKSEESTLAKESKPTEELPELIKPEYLVSEDTQKNSMQPLKNMINVILESDGGSKMMDCTNLKLSGAGIELNTNLSSDVRTFVNKLADKQMDYLTEIAKVATASKAGIDIRLKELSDLIFEEDETRMMIALVQSCDTVGIYRKDEYGNDVDIGGHGLANDLEKMIKNLSNLKDDYLIISNKEPSLYRIFHTNSNGFHDRAYTVYEKQAERIEAQLKIEREDLIVEQLKLIKGIDSDRKRERCEGNIETQKEIIADLEAELATVKEFGKLRMELLKAQRDLRWEKAKEDFDDEKAREYSEIIERLQHEKLSEKYKGYSWSYNNAKLSETAVQNEKVMKRIPISENEALPYVEEMRKNLKGFDVLTVGMTRLEEAVKEWQSNEKMKAEIKNNTENEVEANFQEAKKIIKETLKILEEKNTDLLKLYHDTVNAGNTLVKEKFESVGAGKAAPKLEKPKEIQKFSEQLLLKEVEVKLPIVQQPATELDAEDKQNVLHNLLKAAQKEYSKRESVVYYNNLSEKGREICNNISKNTI